MNRFYRSFYIFPLLVACTLVAGLAQAEINLRWSPGDTTIVAPGGTQRVAIYLDDPINLRTIEVTVTYDTTVVKSLGGGPGALYSESGYFVFEGFEEEPGSWHGFAIIMGAGEYVTGPGELLYWDVEGFAEGISPVISVEALIYNEASPPVLLPDVVLSDATIIVGDPLSAVQDFPAISPRLMVAPNPFNPRTRISFALDQDTLANLSVFDLRGRLVAVLHDGPAQAPLLTADWNGADDLGRTQPGGVYLFRLQTNLGTTWAKGMLVK